jgi:hypothetical protein
MDLDKWQQREAQEFAENNGVTYAEAVAELFPEAPAEAPAPEAAPEVTNPAEADAGKVSVTK